MGRTLVFSGDYYFNNILMMVFLVPCSAFAAKVATARCPEMGIALEDHKGSGKCPCLFFLGFKPPMLKAQIVVLARLILVGVSKKSSLYQQQRINSEDQLSDTQITQ